MTSYNMSRAFPALVRKVFPATPDATIDKIISLFPYPPGTPEKLAWDWTASIAFACNAQSIAKAYGDKGRRYVMVRLPRHMERTFSVSTHTFICAIVVPTIENIDHFAKKEHS